MKAQKTKKVTKIKQKHEKNIKKQRHHKNIKQKHHKNIKKQRHHKNKTKTS
jgi:hypothetical protein